MKEKFLTTTAIIAIILLMVSTLIEMPVKAQEYTNLQEGGSQPLPSGVTPDFTVKTHAFLSFRPNPVGVNQLILVNIWIEPPIHVSRYLKGLKVTITDPDGNQKVITMDSYRGDTTAWFEYIVDKVGTWKIKFEFPGAYYPAGNYTVPPGVAVYLPRVIEFKQSCYYEPSSTPRTRTYRTARPSAFLASFAFANRLLDKASGL
jgi:hypothetical protein